MMPKNWPRAFIFRGEGLRNLETGQAVCRVERSDFDFNLSVPLPIEPDKDAAAARRQEVITGFEERIRHDTSRRGGEAGEVGGESVPAVEPPTSPASHGCRNCRILSSNP